MKLSAILEPLVAAGVSGDVILATVRAFEEQREDALERRRESDRNRQNAKRSRDSRDTSTVTRDSPLVRVEDITSNLDTSKKVLEGAKPKKKPVSRLPDDFKPDIEWAMARGLKRSTAELQAEKFLNYWLAAKDGLKTDWEAAWRTWVLNHIERNGTDGHVSQAPQPVDAERWRKRLVFGRDKASWASVDWGPPPGKPGCLVPPELLKPGDGTGWEEWKSQSAA